MKLLQRERGHEIQVEKEHKQKAYLICQDFLCLLFFFFFFSSLLSNSFILTYKVSMILDFKV